MLLKVTEKELFNRNTLYSPIVHCIHGYWCCLLFWLLFTVYMITVDCHTILLLSLHRPSILSNMGLTDLTKLNNNVNWKLTLGLGKLMEETASVFWVDLRYKLRNWDTVPLQGSERWLTSRIIHIVIVIDYLAVRPGSAPGDWVVVLGMYGIT